MVVTSKWVPFSHKLCRKTGAEEPRKEKKKAENRVGNTRQFSTLVNINCRGRID